MSATTKSGEVIELLPIGTRVRSRRFPELTGYIKSHEWNNHQAGVISPIPYLIGWDNSQRAADSLGWFFVYAGNDGIDLEEASR